METPMDINKYFYFYDLYEVLIDRYPAKIANYLFDNCGITKFVFIYSEKCNNTVPKKVPVGSKVFYMPDLSKKNIEKLFVDYPPSSLTTIAQRIPDMLLLSIFNDNNVPTYIVQHGLWSDHLERISLGKLIISKFSKFIRYWGYTKEICSILHLPFLKTIIELYKFLLIEKISIPSTKYLTTKNIRARKVFVFDESWDDYYIKKYGYDKKDFIYIGNPDFLIVKNKDISQKEDAVCYLCQTIVEDGRYLLKDYKVFLQVLIDTIVSKKKLYIKFHPRSKREYYDLFESLENVIITHDFPICNYYIGHYTSLLGVSKQITDNILIWSLKDHHMPQYFNQFASVITDQNFMVEKFINDDIEARKSDIYIHKLEPKEWAEFNPIRTIANELARLNNLKYDDIHLLKSSKAFR